MLVVHSQVLVFSVKGSLKELPSHFTTRQVESWGQFQLNIKMEHCDIDVVKIRFTSVCVIVQITGLLYYVTMTLSSLFSPFKKWHSYQGTPIQYPNTVNSRALPLLRKALTFLLSLLFLRYLPLTLIQ